MTFTIFTKLEYFLKIYRKQHYLYKHVSVMSFVFYLLENKQKILTV